MKRISRRATLKLVAPALGAAALSGSALLAKDEETPVGMPKRVTIAVGPFNVGELYEACRKREDSDSLGEELPFVTGPADADIVKWLKGCQLYAIDQRVPAESGKWKFASYDDGFPKLAIEGKLFQEFHDKAGKEFTIQIVSFVTRGASTNNSQGERTPQRDFQMFMEFQIRGSVEIAGIEAISGRHFRRIAYDINGDIIDLATVKD